MKNMIFVSLALCGALSAVEPVVKAPVTRVGIFTDGISSVLRQFTSPPGDVIIDEELAAIDGTLFVTPSAATTLVNVKRSIEVKTENPFDDIGTFFKGKKVTITLTASGNGTPAVCTGILQSSGSYITLKQDNGKFISFQQHRIADITSEEIPVSGETEKWVWLFRHRSRIGGPTFISYLTNGLNWFPAMRLTLLPQNKMEIRRSATVSNELEDLKDTDIVLFTGSPNIETRQQIAVPKQKSNRVMAFAAARPESADGAFTPSSGTTEDIQSRSIGKFSLQKGDTLFLPLDAAETEFKRIVVWNIPDKRDHWGRANRNDSGELFDAITFKNPFKDAICSSLTHVVDGEKEIGLVRSRWINPKEEATLEISKCFTVTGKQREYEENGKSSGNYSSLKSRGSTEYIAGHNYRKVTVNGEITLKNHRKSTARVEVKQNFSGELVKSDNSPALTYTDRGVYSVNPQGELKWTLDLPAGKEQKLTYQYTVLVRM